MHIIIESLWLTIRSSFLVAVTLVHNPEKYLDNLIAESVVDIIRTLENSQC